MYICEGMRAQIVQSGPNTNKILDEGIIKYYIKDIITMDLRSQYEKEYYLNEDLLEPIREYQQNLQSINLLKQQLTGDIYKDYEHNEQIMKLNNKVKFIPACTGFKQMEHPEVMTLEHLHRYYKIIPYLPCVMINISPAWKGRQIDSKMIKYFKLYMAYVFKDCERFTKMKYVLECGFGGDLLHCHAVAEINPHTLKMVKTQINKGNFQRSLRKLWAKVNREEGVEGIGGDIEGLLKNRHSIQVQIINKKEIRDDKLDYLIEENKPPSHSNKQHSMLPWGMSYGHPFD